MRVGRVNIQVGASQPKDKGKKKAEAALSVNSQEEIARITKTIKKNQERKRQRAHEVEQTKDAYHRFVQLQSLGRRMVQEQSTKATEKRTKNRNDRRPQPEMTPPLEVPMDPLDQIQPEHMTLSAELPDFEGDQAMSCEEQVDQVSPRRYEQETPLEQIRTEALQEQEDTMMKETSAQEKVQALVEEPQRKAEARKEQGV